MKRSKVYWTFTIILTILSVAMNVFIVTQSCLNGAQSSASSGIAVNFFKSIINFFSPNAINDGNISEFSGVIRKLIGHFGFFAISGVSTGVALDLWLHPLRFYRPERPFLFSLGGGLTLAILTESIQHFVPNRSGEFKDVLIDFGGYVLGALLTYLVILLIIHIRKKRKNTGENKENPAEIN